MTAISDQDRLAMQRLAATAERHNRPRWMVVLAAVVLIIAAIYAFLGVKQRNAAIGTLESARFQQSTIRTQLAELESLSSPNQADAGIQAYAPLGQPVTLLEQAAKQAGMDAPPLPKVRTEKVGDSMSRQIYTYSELRVPSAEDVIAWAAKAQATIPGMEVYRLDMRPATGLSGWKVEIQFSRLEKKP